MTVHDKLDYLMLNGVNTLKYAGMMTIDGTNESATLGTGAFYYTIASYETCERALAIIHPTVNGLTDNIVYHYRNNVLIKEFQGIKHDIAIPNTSWYSQCLIVFLEDLREGDKLFLKGGGTGGRDMMYYTF